MNQDEMYYSTSRVVVYGTTATSQYMYNVLSETVADGFVVGSDTQMTIPHDCDIVFICEPKNKIQKALSRLASMNFTGICAICADDAPHVQGLRTVIIPPFMDDSDPLVPCTSVMWVGGEFKDADEVADLLQYCGLDARTCSWSEAVTLKQVANFLDVLRCSTWNIIKDLAGNQQTAQKVKNMLEDMEYMSYLEHTSIPHISATKVQELWLETHHPVINILKTYLESHGKVEQSEATNGKEMQLR